MRSEIWVSQIDYINIEAIPASHPIHEFHLFWSELCAQSPVPAWNSRLIAEVPGAMSWASLLEADENGRYLVRFCGASYEQMIGKQHQGMYLDEALPSEAMASRLKELQNVSDGNGPLFSETVLPFKDRDYIHVYRGLFGFSTNGTVIDQFVIIIAPKP